MFSYLTDLSCARCGTRYQADVVQGVCACGSPLLAQYDLARLAAESSRAAFAGRDASLWRYHELLPVSRAENIVSLSEGMTPLLALPRLGKRLGVPRLMMKDEGTIPTGSFKARGAAVGVSRAAELGVRGIAMPTNGNAGAAWALYAARAGLHALIAMPEKAPAICRGEVASAGAELYLVRGHIGDCGRIINAAIARREGHQEVSTLKEPYRLEGKKTMGLEIVEQLGWTMPDVIVYPTGGGVGIIGIHKALTELLELGWMSGPLPRLVAVQATGCAPIVKAFEAGVRESSPWPDPSTVAFGINVPKALGDFLILDAIYSTNGYAIAVSDAQLLAAQREIAGTEGALVCPEGAATVAAIRVLRERGAIGEDERVVALNTGAGIKYPETLEVTAPLLDADGEIPAPQVLPSAPACAPR
ncbi:MAG TPA: threonine synthase [Streptosporangiaceae bacterium]|nr:threonine synthase [Streptosporangiaceae bacterium]